MGRPTNIRKAFFLRSEARFAEKKNFFGEKTEELLLSTLVHDPVGTARRLFEPGYQLQRRGDINGALAHYREVVELLESLCDAHKNLLQGSVLAQISLAHGVKLIKLRSFELAIAPLKSSVHFVDAVREYSVSNDMIETLASALGWLALAQRVSGRYEVAGQSYRRAIGLWRLLAAFTPNLQKKLSYQRALAAALFGEGKNYSFRGRTQEGKERRSESSQLFRKLRTNR
jgi:tetratricopeptide (TPR) repeat protein